MKVSQKIKEHGTKKETEIFKNSTELEILKSY